MDVEQEVGTMIQHNKTIELVYDIIRNEASEAHPVSQNEILLKLRENPENNCDRRTVSRALERLKEKYGLDEDGDWIDEHMHLHYTVIFRSSSPIYKDYWFEYCYEDEDAFTDEELMFLMDAVQFSKHIDPKYAEEITGKLAKLSHNGSSGIFEIYTNINEKNIPVRKDIFLIIGEINRAIRLHKMISFYDNRFGVDKKLHHVSDRPVEVCPFRIVVSDGYYNLLYSMRNSDAIKSCRIDRITDVTILDETYMHTAARKNAALHPNEYLVEHRYMNSGDTVKVTLEIDRAILSDVIDAFGTKITIDPADDSANRLTVHVKSSERDIIDWAMRYGEYAVVIDPEYLRNEIVERARIITDGYRNDNSYIDYCERIEKAERFHRLTLVNIDVNGQESYKHLNGISSIHMRHNGIKDFSFLSGYERLRELTISHNEIEDPGVISHLDHLGILCLEMTGVTTLDFLAGMNRLHRLTIHEYSIENVEAIYSLPNLRYLTVNKPVSRLIDKRRLRSVFGDSLKYSVEDRIGLITMFRSTLPVEDRNSRLVNRDLESENDFTTVEVTALQVRTGLCSRIATGNRYSFRDKDFNIIDGACDGEERNRLYDDLAHYTGSEYYWYVEYDGVLPDGAVPDMDKIYAISVFKRDHGRKLLFVARRNLPREGIHDHDGREKYERSYTAAHVHIIHLMDNDTGWAELSGDLERFFVKYCTMQNVIDPAVLVEHNVFEGLEIDGDDFHYYRPDDSGRKNVKKIAYGHIELG